MTATPLSRPPSYYIAISALLFIAFILMLPVAAVYFRAGAADVSNGQESLFQLSRQLPLMLRSLTVAGGATAFALVMGVLVGVATSRAGTFARKVMVFACAASLLTPPYVFAIAWIDLWGPSGWLHRWAPDGPIVPGGTVYSVPGAAIALASAYYPIVVFAVYVALQRIDTRWREAASISGRSRDYFINIALPVIARPITAGAVLVFLLALYDFPVHSLLQVNTYLVEIHAASEYHDYRAAVLLSIPLVIIAAGTIAFGSAMLRDRGNYTDAGIARDHSMSHRSQGMVWLSVGWCVVLIASLLPLLAIAIRAMPPNTFVRLFETAWQELLSSLLLAATSAVIITIIGIISVIVLRHRRVRAAVDILSTVPFLISGPLLGLGLIAVYNRSGLAGGVYDSPLILLLAYTARFVFIGQWGIGAGVRGQAPSMSEAASVAGVSWMRTQLGVVIPQALPYIALVMGATFILAFREIDTAVLVAPPGTTLASVRLFTLMHYGPDQYVMAMAMTMSAVVLIAGAVFYYSFVEWRRFTGVRTRIK
jgi:iron(III) transport system permease protein